MVWATCGLEELKMVLGKCTIQKAYSGLIVFFMLASSIFLISIFIFTKNLIALSLCFLFVLVVFISVSLFLFLIRRQLTHFTNSLCYTLDNLFEEEMAPFQTAEEDTLFHKINHKIVRFYDVMLEKQKRITKEHSDLQELISNISHQVKTPIANLKLVIQTLQNQDIPQSKQCEFLTACATQLDKLDFLMQAMIKTSRLESGVIELSPKFQPIYDTLAIALGGIILNAEKKQIQIDIDCPEDLSAYHDCKWTSEALFNILDNAVKYTPENGHIHVSAMKWSEYVKIDIKDTGPGIPEEHYGCIFQRFYREPSVHDVDGIGIGLYLSRKIISMHGGYMKVASEVGKGSCFSLFLPCK